MQKKAQNYKYRTALFIGRFQPFHNGHLYSLKKCLKIAEKVKIVVAKNNVSGTEDDPWDYKLRKQMVCAVIRKERMEERVARIVSCPDYPSDKRWLTEIKSRAGEFEVVVSNNDWVLSIFREAGYKVYESGLYRREELEGVKIRQLMRKGSDPSADLGQGLWKERVPSEVVKLIVKSK